MQRLSQSWLYVAKKFVKSKLQRYIYKLDRPLSLLKRYWNTNGQANRAECSTSEANRNHNQTKQTHWIIVNARFVEERTARKRRNERNELLTKSDEHHLKVTTHTHRSSTKPTHVSCDVCGVDRTTRAIIPIIQSVNQTQAKPFSFRVAFLSFAVVACVFSALFEYICACLYARSLRVFLFVHPGTVRIVDA